jgi:hypothetical protein
MANQVRVLHRAGKGQSEMIDRRRFLGCLGAAPAAAAAPQSSASIPASAANRPFVGVQLGAHSVFDEGADHCLDLLQESAGVNAVFVYSHTYQGYANGRKTSDLASDHGAPVQDPKTRKLPLVWVRPHEEFYRDTFLRHAQPGPDTEFKGRDVFDTLAEPCRKRGIQVFARVLEGHGRDPMQAIPNWSRILTRDVYGRTTILPCWNHPAYRAWWLGTVEDTFKSYPLAGLKWGAERSGPLSNLLTSAPGSHRAPFCFCEFCETKGRARGIQVERARDGFRQLYEFVSSVQDSKSRPADGIFIMLTRLLIRYPEILAWEQLWHDSKESLKEEIYGTVKQINPRASVGWHIYHWVTWEPIYRAMADYSRMTNYSDWIKPVVYHDVAGPRIKSSTIDTWSKGILRESSPSDTLQMLYGILGYDRAKEPSYDELAKKGLSPDYVYRETRRCVDDVAGKCSVYPGVGFDIPGQGAPSKPETVYEATHNSLEAGAAGLIICREYDEMRLPNLRAVGRAVKERG